MAVREDVGFDHRFIAGDALDGEATRVDLGRHTLDDDPVPAVFRLHAIPPASGGLQIDGLRDCSIGGRLLLPAAHCRAICNHSIRNPLQL